MNRLIGSGSAAVLDIIEYPAKIGVGNFAGKSYFALESR
jgi:hypothetical protein